MTNYQRWLCDQSREFQLGYDAAALGYPRDRKATPEWLRGYDEFCACMTRSERAA